MATQENPNLIDKRLFDGKRLREVVQKAGFGWFLKIHRPMATKPESFLLTTLHQKVFFVLVGEGNHAPRVEVLGFEPRCVMHACASLVAHLWIVWMR